jgi:hypothetical protein
MATPNQKLLNARQAIVNQGGKLKAIPQTEQEKQNVSKSMPMFLQTQPKAKPTPPKGIVATPAPVTTPSPSGPVNQFGVQIDQARQAQEMAQNAMPTLTDEERATALVNQELADAKAKEMELFGESSSVSSLDEMVAKQAEQNKQKKISLEQEIARSEQEKIASDAQARNQAQSQAEAQSVASLLLLIHAIDSIQRLQTFAINLTKRRIKGTHKWLKTYRTPLFKKSKKSNSKRLTISMPFLLKHSKSKCKMNRLREPHRRLQKLWLLMAILLGLETMPCSH